VIRHYKTPEGAGHQAESDTAMVYLIVNKVATWSAFPLNHTIQSWQMPEAVWTAH